VPWGSRTDDTSAGHEEPDESEVAATRLRNVLYSAPASVSLSTEAPIGRCSTLAIVSLPERPSRYFVPCF
jgi:hypothetical protein